MLRKKKKKNTHQWDVGVGATPPGRSAVVTAATFAVVCRVCNESLLHFSRLRLWGKPLFAKVQPEINLAVSGLTEPPFGEGGAGGEKVTGCCV